MDADARRAVIATGVARPPGSLAALWDKDAALLGGAALGLAAFFVVRLLAVAYLPTQLVPFTEIVYLGLVAHLLLLARYGGRTTDWPLVTLLVAIAVWVTAAWCMLTGVIPPLYAGGLLILLVPVVEELFFRGLLLRLLVRPLGWPLAILLITVLFAFMHSGGGPVVMLQMAALSLICCLLVRLRRGLLWAIGFHMLWNAAAVTMSAEAPGELVAGALMLAVPVTLISLALTSCMRDRDVCKSRN